MDHNRDQFPEKHASTSQMNDKVKLHIERFLIRILLSLGSDEDSDLGSVAGLPNRTDFAKDFSAKACVVEARIKEVLESEACKNLR